MGTSSAFVFSLSGLQLGQLHEEAGLTGVDETLVAD